MLATSNWVPVLTSESGLCLTADNWHEAQINAAVYYLDALLLKPGLTVLKTLENLAGYVNWSGELIINASKLKANKLGEIHLKSSYDGSKISLDHKQLIDLINHLKPQRIILPEDILKHYPQLWDELDPKIFVYLSVKNSSVASFERAHGLYFQFENNWTSLVEQLEHNKTHSCYVQGPLDLTQIKSLARLGIAYIESDLPCELAYSAVVYAEDGVLDLKDGTHALAFADLSEQCQCATCTAKLTRAYLHHLYAHTPLLAQRFLIHHNAYFIQKALASN